MTEISGLAGSRARGWDVLTIAKGKHSACGELTALKYWLLRSIYSVVSEK